MPTTLLERRHAEIEHRFYITLLSISVLFDMINPVILILATPESLVYKSVVVTGISPGLIAGLFGLCIVLVLPNTIMTILWKNRFAHRNVIKAAVAGLALSGVVWLWLAFASRKLETAWLVQQNLQSGVIAIAFAGALAVMLNNQMKRIKRIMQNEADLST